MQCINEHLVQSGRQQLGGIRVIKRGRLFNIIGGHAEMEVQKILILLVREKMISRFTHYKKWSLHDKRGTDFRVWTIDGRIFDIDVKASKRSLTTDDLEQRKHYFDKGHEVIHFFLVSPTALSLPKRRKYILKKLLSQHVISKRHYRDFLGKNLL